MQINSLADSVSFTYSNGFKVLIMCYNNQSSIVVIGPSGSQVNLQSINVAEEESYTVVVENDDATLEIQSKVAAL